jgi:hypothetical protein
MASRVSPVAPSQTVIRDNITLKGEQNTFEVLFARTSSRKSLKAKRSGRNGSASVIAPKEPGGWECRLKGQIKTSLPSVEDRTRGDYIPSADKNQQRQSRWISPARQRVAEQAIVSGD